MGLTKRQVCFSGALALFAALAACSTRVSTITFPARIIEVEVRFADDAGLYSVPELRRLAREAGYSYQTISGSSRPDAEERAQMKARQEANTAFSEYVQTDAARVEMRSRMQAQFTEIMTTRALEHGDPKHRFLPSLPEIVFADRDGHLLVEVETLQAGALTGEFKSTVAGKVGVALFDVSSALVGVRENDLVFGVTLTLTDRDTGVVLASMKRRITGAGVLDARPEDPLTFASNTAMWDFTWYIHRNP
ncbi:MAG: hypothetical protein AAFR79_00245 [Pseudomonadota bacterium]